VSAMSGAAIDRGKMNMSAPYANQNTHPRLLIPQPGSIIGEGRRHGHHVPGPPQ
jgi:hypothetical protein